MKLKTQFETTHHFVLSLLKGKEMVPSEKGYYDIISPLIKDNQLNESIFQGFIGP